MDIQVQNLRKDYGQQTAVDNISFTIKTGEILGFLGPNGAGKTTTMKILSCYMAPTGGDVTIGGKDIFTDPEGIKANIGYLPESNPLYFDMPVLEYLEYVAELQGVDRKELPKRIPSIVSQCGLNKEKHKKIGELSKGYKQRVGLAQALIHDPEILILDEPTSGLDPNEIVKIRNLIKNIGKTKTVILSTHILPEVEATCDRILIINKGKIVADGTPDTLRNASEGREIIQLQLKDVGKETAFKPLLDLPAVESVDPHSEVVGRFEIVGNGNMQLRESIFGLCVEKGWVLTEMSVEKTSLEDIFRDLTGAKA